MLALAASGPTARAAELGSTARKQLVLTCYQRTVGKLSCVADGLIAAPARSLACWQMRFASPGAVTVGLAPFGAYASLTRLAAVFRLAERRWIGVQASRRGFMNRRGH